MLFFSRQNFIDYLVIEYSLEFLKKLKPLYFYIFCYFFPIQFIYRYHYY